VFDASAFNADVEAIAHYVLIVAVEFAAEESSDVVGFDGVDDNLTIAREPLTGAGFEGFSVFPNSCQKHDKTVSGTEGRSFEPCQAYHTLRVVLSLRIPTAFAVLKRSSGGLHSLPV